MLARSDLAHNLATTHARSPTLCTMSEAPFPPENVSETVSKIASILKARKETLAVSESVSTQSQSGHNPPINLYSRQYLKTAAHCSFVHS